MAPFAYHVHRPDAALSITVEPYLTSSAIVRVSGPDGDRPPLFTSFVEALKITAGLAELPGLTAAPSRPA